MNRYTAAYWDRKTSGVCARAGCSARPGDAHLLCDEHAADHRERNARHMRESRRALAEARREARLGGTLTTSRNPAGRSNA